MNTESVFHLRSISNLKFGMILLDINLAEGSNSQVSFAKPRSQLLSNIRLNSIFFIYFIILFNFLPPIRVWETPYKYDCKKKTGIVSP